MGAVPFLTFYDSMPTASFFSGVLKRFEETANNDKPFNSAEAYNVPNNRKAKKLQFVDMFYK